jgi:hypothetical protein
MVSKVSVHGQLISLIRAEVRVNIVVERVLWGKFVHFVTVGSRETQEGAGDKVHLCRACTPSDQLL